MTRPNRVAFVAPWFGADIPGGMENAAFQTVRQLHLAGVPVEVLTTTIRDFYADWGRDSHRPGVEMVQGVPVRRFSVQPRDKAAFDDINAVLMRGQSVSPEQEVRFMQEMFHAPKLLDYIEKHKETYIFFFIPYMYATTYYGAQIAPERSLIIPCLHDEGYAHLKNVGDLMSRVRGLVMYAQAERKLADRLYGAQEQQLRLVYGLGVDADFTADGDRFRQKYQLDEPFVLYVGRKEPGKNVPLLLDYWRRHISQGGSGKLVLIGSGKISIVPEMQSHILDLGFVEAQDKYDAYAAAALLCQPSKNESFSIVIMESWLAGTPVLVHGECPVTREHVSAANGGLYFQNYAEFVATATYLLEHEGVSRQMAEQGRRYVLENYTWNMVVEKYKQLISRVVEEMT